MEVPCLWNEDNHLAMGVRRNDEVFKCLSLCALLMGDIVPTAQLFRVLHRVECASLAHMWHAGNVCA